MRRRDRQHTQRQKHRRLGQVALEYMLTTVIMALVASLLYIVYQPLVYSVFAAVDQPDQNSPIMIRDHGLGTRDMMYLPIP